MNDKSKTTAGLLALFLGGLGIHHFYMDNPTRGVIYILFCWTFIPSIIAFIEAIIYFSESDATFANRFKQNTVQVQIQNHAPATHSVHYTEELHKLNDLKKAGIITEEEFEKKKAQILN